METRLRTKEANATQTIRRNAETIAGLQEEARYVKATYLTTETRQAECERQLTYLKQTSLEREELLALHEGWLLEKEATIAEMEVEVRGKDLELTKLRSESAQLRSDLTECQGLALDQGHKLRALRSHLERVRRGVSAFPFSHFGNWNERYTLYTLLA